MANRVTEADVREIYDFDTDITGATANVFILAANILVNKVNTIGGITDTEQLKEIERWLSAHFIAIRDPQASMEKAETVSQTLQQKVDLHFNQTRYGQQALILDTSGTLAEFQEDAMTGGKKKAELFVMQPPVPADPLSN